MKAFKEKKDKGWKGFKGSFIKAKDDAKKMLEDKAKEIESKEQEKDDLIKKRESECP